MRNTPVLDLPSCHLLVVVLKPLQVYTQRVGQGRETHALDGIHLQQHSLCPQQSTAPALVQASPIKQLPQSSLGSG